jgi:hypothetical protein
MWLMLTIVPGSRYAVQRSGNVLMAFNNKVCFCGFVWFATKTYPCVFDRLFPLCSLVYFPLVSGYFIWAA